MRTPRATAAALAAVLTTAVLLAGACGAGPTPQAWAASVCQALAPWRSEIGNLTTFTQQQMTAKTTPAQAKENLVRLMGGAEEATETARKKVAGAGVPDADHGDAVASGFIASLTSVRDAYAKAKTSIEGLATDQPTAFYDGVKSTVDTLNTEYRASAVDTSKLNSNELKQAFDEVPECR